jgi:uncharacterized membrane protein YkoI
MMLTHTMLATTIVILGLAAAPAARSEQSDDPSALATALIHVPMPLQDGLRASEVRGLPISGKYEIEDGDLQLSVYTTDGKKFYEVIVDHATGQVAKSDELSKPDDVTAANEQIGVMALVKISLAAATDKAVQANSGYRAISVAPMTKQGRYVASVTLLRGTTVKTVEQEID